MAATKEWLIDQYGTFEMGGREYYLEDGDTWVDTKSGEVYRGKGFDTSEVYHEGTEDDPIKSPGTARGYQQSQIVGDILRNQGFDAQKKDGTGYYGRTLGVPYNPETETSLSRKLHQEGLVDINSYTSKGDKEAYWEGNLIRGILGEGDGYWDSARAELDAGTSATYIPNSRGDVYAPKQMAIDEQAVAQAPWMYNDVMYRHRDRNMSNKAYSAFDSAWEAGWNNIYGSLQGAKAALGDAINNEDLYQNGMMGVEEYEYYNSQLPNYVQDVGEVKNIKDAGRYMAGMMGQALPYMIGIAGSAATGNLLGGMAGIGALGGISGGAILGAIPPAVTYAGEVYGSMEGEMDEKNVAAAMSAGLVMGILDRVGLHQMMKASSLLKKDGLEKVAIELQKKQGLSSEQARAVVKQASFDVQREVYEHLGQVVNIELSKGILAKEFGSSFLRGAASEGITEGLQESTGYAASVAGSKKEWVQEDYERILVNAVTGGALLGGTIGSTMGTAKGVGSFKQLQRKFSEAADDVTKNFFGNGNNIEQLSRLYGQQGKDTQKFMAMTDEEINDALTDASGKESTVRKSDKEIQEESAADGALGQTEDTVKHKGWLRTLKELPGKAVQKGGSRLLQKYIDDPKVNDEAKYILAVLMDTFAPSNKSHMPGMHLAKTKAVLMHTQLNNVSMAKSEFIRIFNTKKGGKDYDEKIKDFEGWLREKEAGKNNGPMHKKYRYINNELEVLAGRIDAATDTLWNTHKNLVGDKRDPMKGYFFRSSVLNPTEVRKHKEKFVQTLVDGWRSPGKDGKPGVFHKLTRSEAHQLWEDVVSSPDGYQARHLNDAGFQYRKADTLKSLQLHLKDSQIMRDTFLEKDHFEKLKSNIMSVVNHDMDIKTMGRNGINLDRLLVDLKHKMGNNWDPRINTMIKDSIAASRGDYKPIQNRFLASVQGHLTFIGTITQLDTSVLASLPEIGLLLFNAPKEHGVIGLLKDAANDLGKHYKRSIVDTAQHVKSGLGVDMDTYTQNQLDFYNFGYDSTKHGAMGHMDIGQEIDHMSKFKSSVLNAFFTLNLLKPFTDSTRVAKLSMAQDAIIYDLEIVYKHLDGGSNYAADAYERLRQLNIDPITFSNAYKTAMNILSDKIEPGMTNNEVYKIIADESKKTKGYKVDDSVLEPNADKGAIENPLKYVLDNLMIARNSYVDNALANPTAADRPLWYSNPHFRLMTQYKGFLSTFTSHILPRIYRAVKHGNPEAKYQAVAMGATMIMFGFLGQDLKDEWKYESGHNPWLDDAGRMQRGFMASGLLGTPGELINIISPIYDFNRDTFDYASEFLGPFTSTVGNAYKVSDSLLSGDMNRALYYSKKFTPLVGRYSGFNTSQEKSDTENFE
ncbi:MAG: hypothetical protein ABGY11_15430 [Candidatus Thioglobus sp.]